MLVQSGLFEAGAVIVGTHAFLHIGNMLCVQWDRPAGRTEDIDSDREQVISVASPPVEADIRETLLKAEKGVLAVPALDSRGPSTRFSVRNRDLTVSLLTPQRGKPSGKPVILKGLNAAAEPAPDLDYLIEDNQPAAVPAGTGLLIRVPTPARFALHNWWSLSGVLPRLRQEPQGSGAGGGGAGRPEGPQAGRYRSGRQSGPAHGEQVCQADACRGQPA